MDHEARAVDAAVDPFSLERRFTLEEGPVYLNGTQALLRVMLDQRRLDLRNGLNTAGFVCGYPGSPVGNVDREMDRNKALLEEHHIVHRTGLNEELAATAAFGTQVLHDIPGARYDGVFSMWFGKAPGVDRTGDAFHHHNFRGVGRNGGVLAVAGDDPHARSTIFPSDSNTAFYKFYMPVLAPGNIQEVIDFGLHGYALSRACGLWVGFKFVNDVADSAAVAWVGPRRVVPVMPDLQFGSKPLKPVIRTNVAGPPMLEAERMIFDEQLEVARRYAAANHLNRIVVRPPDARIGLLTSGKTYYDLREALRAIGLDDKALLARGIAILKIGMLFPLEPGIVREFARGLEEIVVIEDKRPFLELFVKDILYGEAHRPRIVGKQDERGVQLLPAFGELSPDAIAQALAKRLGPLADTPQVRQRALMLDATKRAPIMLGTARTPFFCSGCPHNSSLKLPDGAIVGAGIGCHIMALWMGPGHGEVKGYTQMGGEGAQWVGLAPFTETKHFFQNLGDGTFAHSGSLAIRFAVATNTHITYKLLYNSTVAMTGGQDVLGGMSVPDMVKSLEAEGVKRILITSDEPQKYAQGKVHGAEVWHRDRLLEAQRLLAGTDGVTVLIHDQQCATEKRRLRKRGKMDYRPRSAFINKRVCEGCGDCGKKSNCLSVQPVETEFGRKTAIHQSSCNQDLSCLKGDCPSFVTVEPLEGVQKKRVARHAPFPSDVVLAEPVMVVPQDLFSICLTGIGGTGVVTVNQVLGTAAFRSGMKVQTYDHTGSSQKAGPVVSHLKVMPQDVEGSPTVGTASADLYLVFDPLVGVSAQNLALASPERTVAIVSTTQVPTGEMVANKDKHYPAPDSLREAIDAASRSAHNVFIDAQHTAERLFGDHMASNMLLVGVAYQAGALPIPGDAIEDAIRLNGTAVEMNLEAFRWGRLVVADRARVDAALAQDERDVRASPAPMSQQARELIDRVGATGELQRVLEVRVPELIAFQDIACAARYVGRVKALREAERRLGGEGDALSEALSEALTMAVAKNLYKLMAYKDEYEVARLLLDGTEQARLQRTFGANARITWHMHPTFLRKLGVKNKIQLGPWFAPVLKLLRWGKRLRGTAFDVFGATPGRRMERMLVTHYESLVDTMAASLTEANHAQMVALAGLPDMVRGYEDVKAGNVALYVAEVRRRAAVMGIDAHLGDFPVAGDSRMALAT
ncbi:indolepyruvate ferredoxin oxidoreductase family protein [Variovorax sp. dw_308]|uniref:indolepyruvate ferredoxin oxidoreductase family protein n=1 Tax=Variovorax sp. dw_308 TaxID=2721546 RepID=UPI001C48CC57|nr:indolepyruvate ferredoxin oxidoreductase family protein [Variovorax sp. dw_308]